MWTAANIGAASCSRDRVAVVVVVVDDDDNVVGVEDMFGGAREVLGGSERADAKVSLLWRRRL